MYKVRSYRSLVCRRQSFLINKVKWGEIECGKAEHERDVVHDDVRFVYTAGTVTSDGTNAHEEELGNPVSPSATVAGPAALATPSLTVPVKRRGRPRKYIIEILSDDKCGITCYLSAS